MNRARLDRRDFPVVVLTATLVFGLLFAPMSVMVAKAFTDGHGPFYNFELFNTHGYRDLLNVSIAQATLNSLRNMLVSACIALVLGILVSWIATRASAGWVSKFFDGLVLMPLGISTIVLGLGYIVTFSNPVFPLRESWLAVPVIQAVMALPLVIRIVKPALSGVSRAQLESAATEGAKGSTILWRIELPSVRRSIVTAAAFACLASIGEFGAASLLAFGDQATLPTVLYSLISRPGGHNYGMAMAASTLLMLFTFLVVLAVSLEIRPLRRRR